jgi:hypothetical protein
MPLRILDNRPLTLSIIAFATIAVLVMEQAGTIKLGPTVNEFEAGGKDGGKVIKFEDVRGVDEAKDVCVGSPSKTADLARLTDSLRFSPGTARGRRVPCVARIFTVSFY